MQNKKFNNLNIIIDKNSWMNSYLSTLYQTLQKYANHVEVFYEPNEIKNGDILFLVSCYRILTFEELSKHNTNIVIHESDLPHGKGWSPLSYQIEEGKNLIPITLFEAGEKIDEGNWYLKDFINFNGGELLEELREKQANKTFEMIDVFLKSYPMTSYKQMGTSTYYKKRNLDNQKLDVDKTILSQFNKLRVCDNENYPAHFEINFNGKNEKYILKIYKEPHV